MGKAYAVESSATTKAKPAAASRAILDPANLPKWFKGAHGVEAADGYPAQGGTMGWRVKWGRMDSGFSATGAAEARRLLASLGG